MASTNQRRPIPSPVAARPISALLLLLPLLLLTPRCSVAQSSPSSGSNNNDDDDNSYIVANYNDSMAILIVVLIGGFFMLGCLSMYLRRCAGNGTESVRVSVRGSAEWRSWRQRGLDPAVLETFPTLVYSEVKELKVGKGALECAVCLCEFEDDETLRLLPKCSHVFHPDCIGAWLASHVTCPVCRSNLVPDPDAPRTTAADLQPPAPAAVEGMEGDGERVDAAPATEGAAAAAAEQVVITVDDEAAEMETREEAAELERIRSRKRAMRWRSERRAARLPRSHSTGHSMVQLGENLDRFTLRLPEHILLKIAAARKLHRSTSCVALPTAGEGSSRRGYRCGGGGGWEGSSRGGTCILLGRSGRWPSSFTFSAKIPAWRRGEREGSVKKGDGEGSTRGKRSAMAPFDCLGGGGKTEGVADEGESSRAALARQV